MLSVGEVARAAGVGTQTIRFYEREGILPRARRTASGYRQFPDEAVAIVHFVKHAQDLGFSLDDVRTLLRLRTPSRTQCGEVRRIAEAKLDLIRLKLDQLERMKAALDALVAACDRRVSSLDCPILETLAERSASV